MRHGIVLALICLPMLTVAIPAQSAEQARMWDVVRSPAWELTVRSVERRYDPLPAVGSGAPVRPAGQYVLFVVDLTNRTSRALTPRSGDFILWSGSRMRSINLAATAAGRAYASTNGLTPFGDAVPPGATIATLVLFDVDVRTARLTLAFLPAGETIRIDECKCDLPSPVRTIEGV